MIVFVKDGRRKTTTTTRKKDVANSFLRKYVVTFLLGVLLGVQLWSSSFYYTYTYHYLTATDITTTNATTSATAATSATATAIATAITTTTRIASTIGSSNSNIGGSMSTEKLQRKNDNDKDDLLYLELTNLPEWEHLSEYEKEFLSKYVKDIQFEAYEQYKEGKATVEANEYSEDFILFFLCCKEWNYKNCYNLDLVLQENMISWMYLCKF